LRCVRSRGLNQKKITHTPPETHWQAALFVIVEVNLLSFIKDEANYSRHTNKSARHALLLFTYSALFFCLSATVSGLILTDEFGELPVRASRKKDPIQEGVFDSGALDLLRTYGAKRSWIWVMWHCESKSPRTASLSCFFMFISKPPHRFIGLFSLVAGTISLITQLLLYIWLEESDSVRITLTFISLFAVLPLLHLVPLPRPQGSGTK
jgi:MFS-type transporter involved in bile tolerance (Atg22 family)